MKLFSNICIELRFVVRIRINHSLKVSLFIPKLHFLSQFKTQLGWKSFDRD